MNKDLNKPIKLQHSPKLQREIEDVINQASDEIAMQVVSDSLRNFTDDQPEPKPKEDEF